jgi:hypothetical protein
MFLTVRNFKNKRISPEIQLLKGSIGDGFTG